MRYQFMTHNPAGKLNWNDAGAERSEDGGGVAGSAFRHWVQGLPWERGRLGLGRFPWVRLRAGRRKVGNVT